MKVLIEHFDRIQLPEAVIEDIVGYLKQSYSYEQEFYQQSQKNLQKELRQVQNRLSKLVDMHLDGKIDADTYNLKLEEYKNQQRAITMEMQEHVNADENCLITVKTVLDLAKRVKELFMSSKMAEKQQLLNFVFSNLKLDSKKLSVTLRKPFSTLCAMSHQPGDLRMNGSRD